MSFVCVYIYLCKLCMVWKPFIYTECQSRFYVPWLCHILSKALCDNCYVIGFQMPVLMLYQFLKWTHRKLSMSMRSISLLYMSISVLCTGCHIIFLFVLVSFIGQYSYHTQTYTHLYTGISIHLHIYIFTHILTYVYTCTNTYIHIHFDNASGLVFASRTQVYKYATLSLPLWVDSYMC